MKRTFTNVMQQAAKTGAAFANSRFCGNVTSFPKMQTDVSFCSNGLSCLMTAVFSYENSSHAVLVKRRLVSSCRACRNGWGLVVSLTPDDSMCLAANFSCPAVQSSDVE